MNAPVILDRRSVLAGSGALIISFSLGRAFAYGVFGWPRHGRSCYCAPTFWVFAPVTQK